ncbi:hypothetical protein HDZ31DRAFT_51894, partial [Schizophyllum fasciatum]
NEKLCLSSRASMSATKLLPAPVTPFSPVSLTNPREIHTSAPPLFALGLSYPPSPPPFMSSHSISSVPPLLGPSPIFRRHHFSPGQPHSRDHFAPYPPPHQEPAAELFSSNAALHWV